MLPFLLIEVLLTALKKWKLKRELKKPRQRYGTSTETNYKNNE